MVRNRNEGSVREEERRLRKAWQIETPVTRGEERHAKPAEQRQLQPIDMAVDHIEAAGTLGKHFERRGRRANGIAARAAEPQRPRNDRHQSRGCLGVAGREQGHLVAACHELFGQPGNNTFGTAIELWRHTLGQRRDLGNAHDAIKRAARRASSDLQS
jgi:hypothetical protein